MRHKVITPLNAPKHIGQIFNRLTVLAIPSYGKGERQQWTCLCSCGAIVTKPAKNVRSGHTKSCGCHKRDVLTKHGSSNSPEYHVWEAMIARCENPNSQNFYLYGGRGITVCKRWKQFENFLADMGLRPSKRHTIDRCDNDGNYEPSNCRWVTPDIQNRNRRGNHNLTHNGITMCITDWAIQYGISDSTLDYRIRVRKMPIDKALTLPRWKRLSPNGPEM